MKKLIALVLIFILAVSCVSIAACGGGGDDDETEEAANGEQETKGEDEDEGTPEDSEETSGSDDLEQMMAMGSYDELDSYHMHMVMTSETPGVGETEMIMDEDVNNKAEASHTVMDMGMGTMETITIGNETWTKMFMQDKWTYSTYEEYDEGEFEEIDDPEDFTDQFDMENDVDYVGKEKVNGVNCKHYKVDSTVTVDSDDPGAMMDEIESSFKGDIWVADEGKLPEVAIKMVGTSTMKTGGIEVVSDMSTDITKINQSITISPPPEDEVMDEGDWGDWGEGDFDMDELEDMFGEFEMPEDFEMPEGWD